MQMRKPILIVGGGIGGMACALALANKGIHSHVIESAPELGEVGAGIQIGPNAFKVFAKLGITEAINNVAVFPEEVNMRDALSNELIFRMNAGDSMTKRFGAKYAVIFRPDLHNAIIDACKAKPEFISISLNKKVTGFTQTANDATVHIEGGASITGAALVGADGLWSAIRENIIGDGKPRVSGHIAYRAVLPIVEVPEALRKHEVTLWAGPKTHLVIYPLRRGELLNMVAVFHSDKYDEGWDTFGDVAELNKRFAGQQSVVLDLLAKINTWKMWVLCDREPAKNWSNGRVTLLGDAAHPMLQYMAQGASMAMEDAVVLAEKIVAHNHGYEKAFLDYQATRYLRTARVQLTARIYGDIYHASGATRDLRNVMLRGKDPDNHEGLAWLYDGI
jgi:3-hydroxybenzoate 6-monooxygenase